MADVFDITQADWTFSASPADILYNTTLPLPARTASIKTPKPLHDAKYWARVTKGLDFSKEDRLDPVAYNRILWQGLKGDKPYPGDANLAETHRRYKEALKHRAAAVPADGDGDGDGDGE